MAGEDSTAKDSPKRKNEKDPAEESEKAQNESANKSEGLKKSAERGTQEGGEKEWVDYDTLNSVEKESLERRIENSILGREESEWGGFFLCFSFCSWLGEQFSFNVSSSPPPAVFFSCLEYLADNTDTPQLFSGIGNAQLTGTYCKAIKYNMEIDFNTQELDIQSLGAAVVKYTSEHVSFFSKDIYSKLRDAYRPDGEDKAPIVARLPFIMKNRDVFLEIANMFADFKTDEQSEIETAKAVWSEAVIREKGGRPKDSLDRVEKMAAFDDLIAAEWYRVPISFFERQN